MLNSDVGEEAGFDDQIMKYISWCNIACGAHAGGDVIIQKTIDLAQAHDVKIGAHPSYPDRENFGRKPMSLKYEDLVSVLTDQIAIVKKYADQSGVKLHHVKPHGALYNEAIKNDEVASAIIQSVKNVDKSLVIISTKESSFSYLCEGEIGIKYEVFADRNYAKDLSLVPRSEKKAVLFDPEKILDHVFRMISEGKVKTIEGEERSVFFDTICVHGDNPKSVQILEYIYKELSDLNFLLK